MKWTSNDINISHTSTEQLSPIVSQYWQFFIVHNKQGDFVAAAYDQKWYVGMIIESDEEYGDF